MRRRRFLGFDIGGTTSTAVIADSNGTFGALEEFPTRVGRGGWQATVEALKSVAEGLVRANPIDAIGISCGGPLDSAAGTILSPPNLPGWDEVPIVGIFRDAFGVPAYLQNDANAGALAEWRFGAGRGTRDMVFVTFGTGLGAGLILGGRLHPGANDLGGEAGHIRLAEDGPIGYHKRGSFEGFCSGTGLAQMMAFELLCLAEEVGRDEMLRRYKNPGDVTGRDVVEWALAEDPIALKVVERSGCYLGKGLAVLIDILNPELIVVGSMGVRLGERLLAPAREVIRKEALPAAAAVCRIAPAELGERIGDFAALCVALEGEAAQRGRGTGALRAEAR
jgi:glucokinase